MKATISQEAYRWSSVAESARRAMKVRYSLLNYMYTLFYHAHTEGNTVMRALAWEFPEDESLKETFSQFMLGPSLLITPVLVPNVDTVSGVFPAVEDGVRWYDWYTLQAVEAQPQENVTLSAPLEHINVHVRGGSILPLQEPGYTTTETRSNPWSILAALDADGQAKGDLYLDDGVSLVPSDTKIVNVSEATSPSHACRLMKSFVVFIRQQYSRRPYRRKTMLDRSTGECHDYESRPNSAECAPFHRFSRLRDP